jgi:YD repeat-containing protein
MRVGRVLILVVFGVAFLLPSMARGQVANAGNDVATPIPGAGHNYIHLLSETVSPANGSVSVDIQLPTAAGRGISLPFSLLYSSGQANHFYSNAPGGTAYFAPDWGGMFRGGWSNSLPLVTLQSWTLPWVPPPQNNNVGYCYYSTGYMFYDSAGAGHALGLATTSPPPQTGDYCSAISSLQGFTSYNFGGDSQVKAAFNYTCGNNPAGQGCEFGAPPFQVFDAEGTIYSFPVSGYGSTSSAATLSFWPSSIEDRNGNIINVSVNSQNVLTATDTAGRTLLSTNNTQSGQSFAPTIIVADGLTYNLSYTTAPSNFSMPAQTITSPSGCGYGSIPEQPNGGPPNVVQTITLPNNQTYTFHYDPTYGLLNEIVYPDGGWVKYTWKPSDNYSEAAAFDYLVSGTYYDDGCNILYKTPVVATRQVSFNGTTPALTQVFTYTTSWNGLQWTSKSTTVQTTDNIIGKTSQTVYNYQFFAPPPPPNTHQWISNLIALEHQIQYYDWGNVTTPIRTVTKTWLDQFDMISQQTTLDNNQTSEVTYQYGFGGTITQKNEYNFGNGTPGALLRKTVTNLQTFPFNPVFPQSVYPPSLPQSTLLASPCQTIVSDANSNPVAETDIQYDGGTAVCGTAGTPSVSAVSNLPAGTHDETNYGPSSSTPRGNSTKITRKCLYGCSPDAVTTYSYDETGQVLSMTDPCGNATCSDMTVSSHTTTYSYADNFDSPPSSNTNAYLTKVTRPVTNGVNHIESYKYAYSDGQLIQSTDENSQSTNYSYNDSLRRLTETDYPDSGKTTISYNDSLYNASTPSPSVTTTRALTSSSSLTTLSAFDGLGHTVRNVFTSDADCGSGDRTDTTYDGMGHVYTVSNPYCTTGDATYGLTTYVYDALGRARQVTNPDNSTVLTTYLGPATKVQDEGNGTQSVTRISQTDGLGRLASVCEVSGTTLIGSSGTPTPCGLAIEPTDNGFLTSYLYNLLNNLQTVSQPGVTARGFVYDSLSRLTSATNPESGTTAYSYDPNGNLSTKTDARGITTTFVYDTLNRSTSKTYSDHTTPGVTNTYDAPVGGLSSTNP